jgi:hypothetical protein
MFSYMGIQYYWNEQSHTHKSMHTNSFHWTNHFLFLLCALEHQNMKEETPKPPPHPWDKTPKTWRSWNLVHIVELGSKNKINLFRSLTSFTQKKCLTSFAYFSHKWALELGSRSNGSEQSFHFHVSSSFRISQLWSMHATSYSTQALHMCTMMLCASVAQMREDSRSRVHKWGLVVVASVHLIACLKRVWWEQSEIWSSVWVSLWVHSWVCSWVLSATLVLSWSNNKKGSWSKQILGIGLHLLKRPLSSTSLELQIFLKISSLLSTLAH